MPLHLYDAPVKVEIIYPHESTYETTISLFVSALRDGKFKLGENGYVEFKINDKLLFICSRGKLGGVISFLNSNITKTTKLTEDDRTVILWFKQCFDFIEPEDTITSEDDIVVEDSVKISSITSLIDYKASTLEKTKVSCPFGANGKVTVVYENGNVKKVHITMPYEDLNGNPYDCTIVTVNVTNAIKGRISFKQNTKDDLFKITIKTDKDGKNSSNRILVPTKHKDEVIEVLRALSNRFCYFDMEYSY